MSPPFHLVSQLLIYPTHMCVIHTFDTTYCIALVNCKPVIASLLKFIFDIAALHNTLF